MKDNKKNYGKEIYENMVVVQASDRGDRLNITVPSKVVQSLKLNKNNKFILIPNTNIDYTPKEGDFVGFYIINENKVVEWKEGKIIKNSPKYYDLEDEEDYEDDSEEDEEEYDDIHIEEYDKTKKYALLDISYFFLDDEINNPYEIIHQFNDFENCFGLVKKNKAINKNLCVCSVCKTDFPIIFKFCYNCGTENKNYGKEK